MGKRGHILVVSENEDLRHLLRMVLEGEGGLPVECCPSATDYLTSSCDAAPSLLLLTLDLPATSALVQLRSFKSHPKTQTVPALVLSADYPTCQQAIQAGADDYLRLPFDIEELQTRVRQLIRLGRLHRSNGTS